MKVSKLRQDRLRYSIDNNSTALESVALLLQLQCYFIIVFCIVDGVVINA